MENKLQLLIEKKKKIKKLPKEDELDASNLVREELTLHWNKDSTHYGDVRALQLLAPDKTADIITQQWDSLHTNYLERWFSDIDDNETGLKCGVRVAVSQINSDNTDTAANGRNLLLSLLQTAIKSNQSRVKKAFVAQLFDKNTFRLPENWLEDTEQFHEICNDIWKVTAKKTIDCQLAVGEWICGVIKNNEHKLIKQIKKKLSDCKKSVMRIYDDIVRIDQGKGVQNDTAPTDWQKKINELNLERDELDMKNRSLTDSNQRLSGQMEKLKQNMAKKEEKIDEMEEKAIERDLKIKELTRECTSLKDANESCLKSINELKDEKDKVVAHLEDRLERVPEIKMDEFKNRIAGKLRMYVLDMKAIDEKFINSEMEKVLYGQFTQLFQTLREQGIKTGE